MLPLPAAGQENGSVNLHVAQTAEGRVVYKRGLVKIRRAVTNRLEYARSGSLLYAGDLVQTGPNASARLVMADETMMHLGRNSQMKIEEVASNAGWLDASVITDAIKKASRSVYSLISGRLWARNKNKHVRTKFKTVSATFGIRGTELVLSIGDDEAVTSQVIEGRVAAENGQGNVVAEAGQQVTVSRGQAPRTAVLLNPVDAVQWTFIMPPLLDAADFAALPIPDAVREALRREDYAAAAKTLGAALSQSPEDTGLQILQAGLAIFNGRPLFAYERLSALRSQAPDNPLLLRALATAALMVGKTQQAEDAAVKAVALTPDNATGHIVLAYVQQSRFELEAAMRSVRKALQLAPDNIMASVMLASLQFGSGYNEQAMDTVLATRDRAPQDARLNNLAGFILLSHRRLEEARNAFDIALRSDPGEAEAHLGLAIINMREGKVKPALAEMTTAVALEPQRAMFLSYWGKMLYQIKRFDKALDMFEHAARLDPNDPTPLFYQAIVLRDLNRHGEAIERMNQAIARNDNRGVYRSRFLLDEDLAVRNVDLSILYERLGLSRWAEAKSVAAIKSDYTNYSAHLFFAGSLSREDDRSYVFGSEALLARLLQPANINTFNTFNEYTTLFEQPDVSGQLSVGAGTQGTAVAEAVVYGASPSTNFAWNVGVFGDTTDGWRDTNGEDRAAAAVIGKWQPNERNGVFVSGLFSKYRQMDKRYPRYEFDDPASPDDRLNLDLSAVELGYHHNASPGDDFLAYLTWQGTRGESYTTESSLAVPPALYTQTDNRSDFERPYAQLQLQYMKKFSAHQLIAGAVGFSGKSTLDSTEQIDAVDKSVTTPVVTPLFTNLVNNDVDIESVSVYAQDNWRVTRAWHVEAALYYDRMDNASALNGDSWRVEKVNPRLGFIWTPTHRHTLRLAAYRYLLPFVSSRTDPTEIAGIPIARNTIEGTQTDEASFVWEYERAYGLYTFNLFALERSNQVSKTSTLKGRQKGGQLGLDMLASKTIGVFLRYRYEDIEDEVQPAIDRQDHLLSLGLKHQAANGFSAGITQLYRSTRFDSSRTDENIPLTDIELGYEFPGKRGRVDLFVKNVFDKQFNWVVDQFTFNGRNPAREVLLTGTFNF